MKASALTPDTLSPVGAEPHVEPDAPTILPPGTSTPLYVAEPGASDQIAPTDAFEPPPPASVVTRQAQQAQAQAQQPETNADVQIMRASSASRGMPAPTQTNDDPIARFANGNF